MAANERERNKRSCASRSSLVFSSTRFSRVTFHPRISSVRKRISLRAAESELAMELKALASSPSSSLEATSISASNSPWAMWRDPCTSVPTRLASERASAAPTTAATKAATPTQ